MQYRVNPMNQTQEIGLRKNDPQMFGSSKTKLWSQISRERKKDFDV